MVSKKEGKDPYYLISTDPDLSCKEIIEIYENRWNLEMSHEAKLLSSSKQLSLSRRGLELQNRARNCEPRLRISGAERTQPD